jgi:hypothetical protein
VILIEAGHTILAGLVMAPTPDWDVRGVLVRVSRSGDALTVRARLEGARYSWSGLSRSNPELVAIRGVHLLADPSMAHCSIPRVANVPNRMRGSTSGPPWGEHGVKVGLARSGSKADSTGSVVSSAAGVRARSALGLPSATATNICAEQNREHGDGVPLRGHAPPRRALPHSPDPCFPLSYCSHMKRRAGDSNSDVGQDLQARRLRGRVDN